MVRSSRQGYFYGTLGNSYQQFMGILFLLGMMLISCGPIRESSKYQFTEGFYTIKSDNRKERVYVLTGTDSIKVFSTTALNRKVIDTTQQYQIIFPPVKPIGFTKTSFARKTLDLDVLTVLFKYRPSTENFPPQFNATFNGAIYLGYRTDVYQLQYHQTPLHVFKREINHFGYSAGIFTGLGTARIDEYVTNNAIAIQYDGLVNLSGIAFIAALNKLTAGVTLGVDHLLDKNHAVWVNNGKIWIGLSVGLNLN